MLAANLKRQGVEVHFKHKGQTNEVQGVVFIRNGYHFNGSKVDRRFSYSKIDAVLQCNRNEERIGMTAKAHEVATPNAPSATTHAELFTGSLGLLNGDTSSYNAADAKANQELAEILRWKKETQTGNKIIARLDDRSFFFIEMIYKVGSRQFMSFAFFILIYEGCDNYNHRMLRFIRFLLILQLD